MHCPALLFVTLTGSGLCTEVSTNDGVGPRRALPAGWGAVCSGGGVGFCLGRVVGCVFGQQREFPEENFVLRHRAGRGSEREVQKA